MLRNVGEGSSLSCFVCVFKPELTFLLKFMLVFGVYSLALLCFQVTESHLFKQTEEVVLR